MVVFRGLLFMVVVAAGIAGCSHAGPSGSLPPPASTDKSPLQQSAQGDLPEEPDLDRVFASPSARVSPVTFTVVPSGARAPSVVRVKSSAGGSAYADTVLADSPEAYYRLGDTGPTAADSSVNNHPGTFVGVGAGLAQGTPGLLVTDAGLSATWNGTAGAYVSAPRDPALEVPSGISVEAWVKPATDNGNQSLVEYGDNASTSFKGFGLKIGGHGFQLKVAAPPGTSTNVGPASGLGAKPFKGLVYHVVGTYDGSVGLLYVNGRVAWTRKFSGPITYDTPAHNMGLVIGNNQSAQVPANGVLQEVALYKTVLSAAQVQAHYAAGVGPGPTPTPSPTATPTPLPASYVDWSSFGFDLPGTRYNPSETTISSSNAGALHKLWSVDLGEKITATPVLAKAISTASGTHNLLYIGTEGGVFYAVDADSGTVVWSRTLGKFTGSGCGDLGGSPYGITASAVFDRSANRVYVVDGQDMVYALKMDDGSTVSGWPVLLADVAHNTAYSGLVLNPANGFLYAGTASYCDFSPWQGRIAEISTGGSLGNVFFPAATAVGGSGVGGGIWGPGIAVIDPGSNDVFVVTGNDNKGATQHVGYSEHVVRLDASLTTVGASNYPGLSGIDVDFGATPMLFTTPGCSSMVVAKNKAGVFVQWGRDTIGNGPIVQLKMSQGSDKGNFIGAPAFSPQTNLVYVSNWSSNGVFKPGLVALSMNASCVLQLQWNSVVSTGSGGGNRPTTSPAVGNGVVYFGSGIGNQVYAIDAASGTLLWTSGSAVAGPTFAAPIIDGHLFIGSWDHKLYAFGV
jgi:outer membrane protein assembly factor BamB